MPWRGRRQLGQEAVFDVISTAGDPGVPSWPGSPPVLDLWRGTTPVVRGLTMPKVDGASTGLFRLSVFLDSRFQVGYHEAVIRWKAGTYYGVQFDPFWIIDGGDVRGDVLAMIHQELPQARYIVYQGSGGRLLRGKNPSY